MENEFNAEAAAQIFKSGAASFYCSDLDNAEDRHEYLCELLEAEEVEVNPRNFSILQRYVSFFLNVNGYSAA